ncbi:hypothetical protein HHI36_010657 [Cryptolaemus montrouzieri]|uniref:Uncharacterized protein n=1 Tax=Cryptolaemus montrouzieri TaxID=559131 RepID=A0ABD2MJR2_9CUCU
MVLFHDFKEEIRTECLEHIAVLSKKVAELSSEHVRQTEELNEVRSKIDDLKEENSAMQDKLELVSKTVIGIDGLTNPDVQKNIMVELMERQ